MKTENSKCLVLNGDYSPLGIIDWKKAIIWCVKYENKSNHGIEILDFYKDDFIIGVHDKKHPIPAVVKTNRYFRINNQKVTFSRKNLFIRDGYTCQYCGNIKEINKLTYDHVIPKSSWKHKGVSPTSWTNIVTVKGQSPFMHEPNDGVVTIASQRHHDDMELVEVDCNHYEVVLSDAVVRLVKERVNKFKK